MTDPNRIFIAITAVLAALALSACQSGTLQPAQPAPEAATAKPHPGPVKEVDTLLPKELPGDPAWEMAEIRPRGELAGSGGFNPGSPRELMSRSGSAVHSLVINAASFDDTLPNHSVEPSGNNLRLTPLWDDDGGAPSDLALAIYRVSVADYDGESLASLSWMVPPADLGDTWLGLGNLATDRWDWFSATNPDVVDLPPFNYYRTAQGEMLMALVVVGHTPSTLYWIRLGGPQAPDAVITADAQSGRAPLEVNFDASLSSDNDGTITNYSWDLDGDGTFEHDSGLVANASHTYESPGIYAPAVRIEDDSLLFDVANLQVNVTSPFNQAPEAYLTATPKTGSPPLLVEFNAAGSSDNDGEITTYEWDWDGDGTYEQLTVVAQASYNYASDGSYNATVRVTDNEFASATDSVAISVMADPEAALSVDPQSGNAPFGLNMDASASQVPGGTITRYDWDWDGDSVLDAQTVVPYAQFGVIDEGEYASAVTVHSEMGPTDTAVVDPPVRVRGFSRSYGGSDYDFFNAVAADGAGAIIGAGSTNSFGAGSYDGLVLKLDGNGAVTWARTWGGSGTDDLTDTVADAVGNIYIAGYTKSYNPGGANDAFAAKFSPNGTLSWTRSWGRDGNDWFNDMDLDGLGGVVTVGETVNIEYSSMEDFLVVKHDTNGNFDWAKTYSCGRGDSYPFVSCDSSGNIYVTGRSVVPPEGIQASLIKISPAGELLSQQQWGGGNQDGFYCSTFTPDGSMYITGYTKSYADSEGDALLVKLDPDGNFAWARSWGTDYGETLTAVHLGADGLLYCCGIHSTDSNGDYGLMLTFTTDGDFLSSQKLTTTNVTRLWDGMSLGDWTFVMVGSTVDAYGTWSDFPGTLTNIYGGLSPIEEGGLTDGGGINAEHTAESYETGTIVENTGGGELDCLAVAFRTPAAE